MKQERKEGLSMIVVGVVWMVVSFLLFLVRPEYALDNFLSKAIGGLKSLVMIPVYLIMIIVYFGGVFAFFSGCKQFITGEKAKDQKDSKA